MPDEPGDASTAQLAELFRSHPAFAEASPSIDAGATSNVYFRHRPGEAWRLERSGEATRLRLGASQDPDFAFRFSEAAIERLEGVGGGIGDFAVGLFSLIVEGEIDLRIVAGFGRLARRGYLRLLLAAGPAVIAFGARHGIRTLGALRSLVRDLRSRAPAQWETVTQKNATPNARLR
jgi:hypothetical protein